MPLTALHPPMTIVVFPFEINFSTCTDKNWYSLPKRIKWSPKSLDELSKLLNNVPDEKIDSITRKLNQSDIYEATSMLIELIENSCK